MYSFFVEVVIISWLCSRVDLYTRRILYNSRIWTRVAEFIDCCYIERPKDLLVVEYFGKYFTK